MALLYDGNHFYAHKGKGYLRMITSIPKKLILAYIMVLSHLPRIVVSNNYGLVHDYAIILNAFVPYFGNIV